MAEPIHILPKELTQAVLNEFIRYDPLTGVAAWAKRDVRWFSDESKHTAKHSCCAWNARFPGQQISRLNNHGYIACAIFRRTYLLHRLIWLREHGDLPEFIDHISGDRTDNRLINLREATRIENNRNSSVPSHNKSGITGVSWRPEKCRWSASITVDRRKIFLGYFTEREAAVRARREAELKFDFHANHGKR